METLIVKKADNRNYGVDLLRIVAMFMVVTLHVLGKGGLLSSYELNSIQYIVIWTLEAFCICSVNVYAIISGYVGIKAKFRLHKLISMWLQVLFFVLLSYALCVGLGYVKFSVREFISCFIPVVTYKYWYFSAYFLVFLLMPFYNLLMEKMSKHIHLALNITLIILMSFVCGYYGDTWGLAEGYSPLWLSVLYFIGAYFAKYGLLTYNKKVLTIIFLIASFFICGTKFILNIVSPLIFGNLAFAGIFYSYTSIFAIIQSIALLNLFAKINLKKISFIKIIKFVSSLTFGIYLVHLSDIVWNNYLPKIVFIAKYPFYVTLPLALAFTLAIFLGCGVIEYIRQLLFKYTGINALVAKFGNWLQNKYFGIIKRIAYGKSDQKE